MRMLSGIVGKFAVYDFGIFMAAPLAPRSASDDKSKIENRKSKTGGKSLLTLLARGVHNPNGSAHASFRALRAAGRPRPEGPAEKSYPPSKAGHAVARP